MNTATIPGKLRATLSILVLFSADASAQWVSQSVPPGVSILLSADFASTQDGCAGGYHMGDSFAGGGVYTADGGASWTLAQVPDSARALVSVQLLANGLGYAAGAFNSSLAPPGVPPVHAALEQRHSPASARAAYALRIGMVDGVGTGGLFLKTTNRGQSWSTWGILPESTYYLVGLSFPTPDTGFVTAQSTPLLGRSRILKTTDGGTTWTAHAISDSIVALPSIEFRSALLGFAVGYQHLNDTISGVILRTTDGGANWERRDFPQVDNFTMVSFASESTAYATGVTLGGNAVTYSTTDAGIEWTPLPFSPASTLLQGVCAAEGTPAGIVFGSTTTPEWTAYAARTTDGGASWVPALLPAVPSGTLLLDGVLLNENIGYLVGGSPSGPAVIFHTANGGVTHILERGDASPRRFELSQNYPNPFNSTTAIEFSVPEARDVTLSIFDLLGREVATLVAEQIAAGSYRAHWNAADMPSGAYCCRLRAGDRSQTKTLVLVR